MINTLLYFVKFCTRRSLYIPLLAVTAVIGVFIATAVHSQDTNISSNDSSEETQTLSVASLPLSSLWGGGEEVSTTQDDIPIIEKETHTITLKVLKGDTLVSILKRAGVKEKDTYRIIQPLKEIFNPRSLYVGQELTVNLVTPEEGEDLSLSSLIIQTAFDKAVKVFLHSDGSFKAEKVGIVLEKRVERVAGRIDSSFFASADAAGAPAKVIMDIINAYSYDIDFQRDIRKGNRFEVLYESFFNETGRHVYNGEIIYALLGVDGTDYEIYQHTTAEGETGYFDAKGKSIRKSMLRTPVNGARISSGYGMRKHPILGYSKMHKGIDFAAPTGTPIYAAANGRIERIGRNKGYGNYIRIRHPNGYSTAYAHIHRFAKHLRKGSKVKQGQVIAYVGSTGRSTGPHLHFEILKNGKHINPKHVKASPEITLKSDELKRFVASRENVETLLAVIAPKVTEAMVAQQ